MQYRRSYQESDVICRWRHADGLVVDLIPPFQEALGFSNRCNGDAMASATRVRLPSGARMSAVSPAMSVATEVEAWRGSSRR
jgi:hypothetical protein